MSEETPFRIALITAFAVFLTVMLNFRIRSWASKEKLDRMQEGLFILVALRLAGLALWLAVFAYMIDPGWMTWSSIALPFWARWLGVLLYAASIALLVWTLRNLGTNLTDTVVTRREHTLVTEGLYRWVRHPFYGTVALVILANAILAANWFFLLSGAAVLGLLALRTRIEEGRLIARFGDAYRTYMSKTGRFVPRWRS